MDAAGSGNLILCVVGARPNLMKIAPVIRAMRRTEPPIAVRLLHTGQHYDRDMNGQHFTALGIPDPDRSRTLGIPPRPIAGEDLIEGRRVATLDATLERL